MKRPKSKSTKKRLDEADQSHQQDAQMPVPASSAEGQSPVFIRPWSSSFSVSSDSTAPPAAKRRRRRTSSLMSEFHQSTVDVSSYVSQLGSTTVVAKRDSTECVSVTSMDDSGTEAEAEYPSMNQSSLEDSLLSSTK